MALQGFNKEYYLQVKLEALQSDPKTSAEWQGRDTAALENILRNDYGLTPEQHYARYGYQEGLSPNAYFDAEQYVQAKAHSLVENGEYATLEEARNAFETAWQGNPYQHYLKYGADEGVNPSNDFDASAYFQEKLAALQSDPSTAAQWADRTVEDVRQAFDKAGLTPLSHFIAYGNEEDLTAPEVPADEAVLVTEKPTDPGGEEPTSPSTEEPASPSTGEPTSPGADEPIAENEILTINGIEELQGTYDFDTAELSGYRAIRFSGINSSETTNVLNLSADNKVFATGSTVALNIADAASVQVEIESGKVVLYGNLSAPVLNTLDVTAPGVSGSLAELELAGSAAGALTDVTLTGAGDLNLLGATIGEQAASATTIDASGMSGSLTAAEGVLDAADSIQSGSGDDSLMVDGIDAPENGAAPAIDGGAGNDTLIVTGSDEIVSPNISSIETLQFDSYVTIDAGVVADATNFIMGSGGKLFNLAADQTVTATSGGLTAEDSPLILRDAAQTVNVVTQFSTQGQVLDLGIYTSTPAEGQMEIEGGTLNLSGNGGVAYTEAGRKFDIIDASSLESGLDFTGADYVQESVILGGSEAADMISVTTTNSAGETILTSSYGEGDMDTIQNFDLTTDRLVADDGSSVVDFAADQVDVSSATDLASAFDAAASQITAADPYVAFAFQGNTYVYADSEAPVDNTAPTLSDGDFAIELLGVSLPSSTTDSSTGTA